MSKGRIIYQEWIVDLGRDPGLTWQEAAARNERYDDETITAVNEALAELPAVEEDFLRLFYFQGMGYQEISRITGRRVHRLERLNQEILRKIRRRLEPLLDRKFRSQREMIDCQCLLCRSPQRDQINRLIGTKKKNETWRRIIRILDADYGLKILSPQQLITHSKYHLKGKEKPNATD